MIWNAPVSPVPSPSELAAATCPTFALPFSLKMVNYADECLKRNGGGIILKNGDD
jgi:hypothetical protein